MCVRRLGYNYIMVRFIRFLAVALVLQLTWGVASAYCMHESGQASQHFGHHQHEHQPSAADTDTDDDGKSGAGKFKAHPDCASCTHGQIGVFSLDVGAVPSLPVRHEAVLGPFPQTSPFLGMPERPQWNIAA